MPTRTVFLLPAMLAMLAGVNSALQLLGVWAPVQLARLVEVHGLLMTLGFVATLIALERAVALGRWYGYLSPALLGISAIALLSPAPVFWAHIGQLLGLIALVICYFPLWLRNQDTAVLIQWLGAVSAAFAPLLLLLGLSINQVIPWLAGLVILTIAGERLELARLTMPKQANSVLLLLSANYFLASFLTLLHPTIGYLGAGAALLLLTLYLAEIDVAKKTVHTAGLPRFMAVNMLTGYFWLAIAALIWLTGEATSGYRYDAVIHTIFLGFTISMIMAHAPIILPAVLKKPLPFRQIMWMPFFILQLGLLLRIWLGDGIGNLSFYRAGGILNAVALSSFFLIAAGSMLVASLTSSASKKEVA